MRSQVTRNALDNPQYSEMFCTSDFFGPNQIFYDVIFPSEDHLRSKVKVPNESPVMTSYLNLIVNLCLSGTVF